jgi:hypothetical protein
VTPTVTLPATAVAGVFLVGVLVGWLIAKRVRVEPSLASLEVQPDPQSPGTVRLVRKTVARNFILKCQCGAVWKFAEAGGPLPPGYEPAPSTDSFACRQCGRAIDLKAAREAERQALAELDPSKRRI